MKNSSSFQKHTTKWLPDKLISTRNTYTYTHINPKTQSGDRVIIQSYTVQQPLTGGNCKDN